MLIKSRLNNKGGAAATHYKLSYGDTFDFDGVPDPDSSASRSGGRFGYTIGGGVEWAFADKWTTKLEYQYFDFGEVRLTDIEGNDAKVKIDAHTIKIGLNYKDPSFRRLRWRRNQVTP